MEWSTFWSFSHASPLELFLRGSAMYWFLFLIFRFVMRRDMGAVGIADVLLVVLIADAAQNAMGGEYRSVSEGAVLVLTLVGWNLALDRASYQWSAVRRFVEPAPLLLVQDGRAQRRNLRHEMLTMDELQSHLREHGVEDLSQVKRAWMESDGTISVIRHPAASAQDGESAGKSHNVATPNA